jgi:hypothetical protein
MGSLFLFFSLMLNKNIVNPPAKEEYIRSNFDTVEIKKNKYTVYYDVEWDNFEYFTKNIDAVNNKVAKFIESKKINTTDCKPNKKLKVYHVSLQFLNDKALFYKWQVYGKHDEIWGLYDSLYSDVEGKLYLTNHSDYQNVILMSHEVSHYWFDRLCLSEVYAGSTEDFAMEFQEKIQSGKL